MKTYNSSEITAHSWESSTTVASEKVLRRPINHCHYNQGGNIYYKSLLWLVPRVRENNICRDRNIKSVLKIPGYITHLGIIIKLYNCYS